MSLKSLAFTVLPSSTRSLLEARRDKTIELLQEQKQLIADPNHVRSVKKWGTVGAQRRTRSSVGAVGEAAADAEEEVGLRQRLARNRKSKSPVTGLLCYINNLVGSSI